MLSEDTRYRTQSQGVSSAPWLPFAPSSRKHPIPAAVSRTPRPKTNARAEHSHPRPIICSHKLSSLPRRIRGTINAPPLLSPHLPFLSRTHPPPALSFTLRGTSVCARRLLIRSRLLGPRPCSFSPTGAGRSAIHHKHHHHHQARCSLQAK